MFKVKLAGVGLLAAGAVIGFGASIAKSRFVDSDPLAVVRWSASKLSAAGCKKVASDSLTALGGVVRETEASAVYGRLSDVELAMTCLDFYGLVHIVGNGAKRSQVAVVASDLLNTFNNVSDKIKTDDPLYAVAFDSVPRFRTIDLGNLRNECGRVAESFASKKGAEITWRGGESLTTRDAAGNNLLVLCVDSSTSIAILSAERVGEDDDPLLQQAVIDIEDILGRLEPTLARQFDRNLDVREYALAGKFSTKLCLSLASATLRESGREALLEGFRVSTNKDGIWLSISCGTEDLAQILAIADRRTAKYSSMTAVTEALHAALRKRLPLKTFGAQN